MVRTHTKTTLMIPADIPTGSTRKAARRYDSPCTSWNISMNGKNMTDHHPRVMSAKKISTAKLGNRHIEVGMRAFSYSSRDSCQKKRGNSTQEMRNGARKVALSQPYDAPRVRPTMKRMIATWRLSLAGRIGSSRTTHVMTPITSKRLMISFLEPILTVSFGINLKETNAPGMLVVSGTLVRVGVVAHANTASNLKNHLQSTICVPISRGINAMTPAINVPVTFAIDPVIPYKVYALGRSSGGKVIPMSRYAEGTKAAAAIPEKPRKTKNAYLSVRNDKIRLRTPTAMRAGTKIRFEPSRAHSLPQKTRKEAKVTAYALMTQLCWAKMMSRSLETAPVNTKNADAPRTDKSAGLSTRWPHHR